MSGPSSVSAVRAISGTFTAEVCNPIRCHAVVGPILIARNPVGSKSFIAGVVLLVLPFACILLLGLGCGLYRLLKDICKCARNREVAAHGSVVALEFELRTNAQSEIGPTNEEGLPQSEAAKSMSDPASAPSIVDEPTNSSAAYDVAPPLTRAAPPDLDMADAASVVGLGDVAVAVRDDDPVPFVSSEGAEQGPPAVTSAPSSLGDGAAVDDGIPAPSASYEVHFMSSN